MENKVVLILVDGMRPDAVLTCDNSYLRDLRAKATHCFSTRTVFPSVTLPCHTSLFLGVDPIRHGITTNLWMPPVRPIDGIFESVNRAGKKCAMFTNWQQLRDLAHPDSMSMAYLYRQSMDTATEWANEDKMTQMTIDYIKAEEPDFTFLYLGAVDEVGHRTGWMNDEYMRTVSHAAECISRVMYSLPDNYQFIIVADHGGHDRTHGTEMPEDMTIPLLCVGSVFEEGKELPAASIKDIAPTVAKILGTTPSPEWEGTSIL